MTELLCSPKVKPEHLARKAIVYCMPPGNSTLSQCLIAC
jgi:hypothetical protein